MCREGVFDKAVAAIRVAQERGFRVTTNTTFFTHDTPDAVRQVLDFLNDELRVDHMMISPASTVRRTPRGSSNVDPVGAAAAPAMMS